jgi:hypothetical protein
MEKVGLHSSDHNAKLRKYKKYRRHNGLPKALKGAASGGRPDKYCPGIRDAGQLRSQPSLARVAWLDRPDPCPEAERR